MARNHTMKPLPRLDVLRGIAILGVMLYHRLNAASGRDRLGWAGDWLRWEDSLTSQPKLVYPAVLGMTGMPLFFLLSGYLIHGGDLRRFWLTQTGLIDYGWQRFWRIYLAYSAALNLFSVGEAW